MSRLIPYVLAVVVATLVVMRFVVGSSHYLDSSDFNVRAMVSEDSDDPSVELMRLHIETEEEWKGVAAEGTPSRVELRLVRGDAPDSVQVDAPRVDDEHIWGPHVIVRTDRSSLSTQDAIEYIVYGADNQEVEAKVTVTPGESEE